MLFSIASWSKEAPNTSLIITKYDWNITVDYSKPRIYSTCEIEIKNLSDKKVSTLPFVLYRLLKVTSVTDENDSLPFSQKIQSFEDQEKLQSNFISVKLKKALHPTQSTKIKIAYEGILYGYTEVGWNYVQDKLDPEFTILRPDCMAYPELGYPSNEINKKFPRGNFDYRINVSIPDSLVAVNGGLLISRKTLNGISNYQFRNIKKAWRMDIAISEYQKLSDNGLTVYYLKGDSVGAKMVLHFMQRTFKLYSQWWGTLEEFEGFSVIEIRNGFGSQADVTSILQTSSVFNDSTEMHQLYHEISHVWNVDLKEPSPRWEEGLATFIEYLTIEKLENRKYLDYVTNWYLNIIRREIAEVSDLKEIPLVNFGKYNMTDYSYSLGMISFRLLYEIVGEEKFNKINSEFYRAYNHTTATTEDFAKVADQVSAKDLSKFFHDWFFTTTYVQHLKNKSTIIELVEIYK